MNTITSSCRIYFKMLLAISRELFRSKLWLKLSSNLPANTKIDNCFGINISTSADPECDDYVIQALGELDIKQVRIAFSYDAVGNHQERLLERVLSEGFQVMLTIFPLKNEAAQIHLSQSAEQRWSDFVRDIFFRYHDRVELFEIGTTVNRKKWSGFSILSYLRIWKVALPFAEQYGLRLAGPNISDFEPLYNIAYLSQLKSLSTVPAIQTDNLFVERAIEPEAYDHRVLGHWAAKWLKLDLIKKAKVIDSIGKQAGCLISYCTYNCWTLKRLSRRNIAPEEKQVDYLVRYLILSAVSGALEKIYWGPLICSRDGIIDCGSDFDSYPQIDNVAYYRSVRGEVSNFRPRPAFLALKNVLKHLNNTTCIQGVSAENGISHFIFIDSENIETHITWCRDGYAALVSSLYSGSLDGSICLNSTGTRLDKLPLCITEHPIFIQFPPAHKPERPDPLLIQALPSLTKENIAVRRSDKMLFHPFSNSDWVGAVMLKSNENSSNQISRYIPESLEASTVVKVLRDKRNKIWNIEQGEEILTVKLNRTVGIKKFTYRFQSSKAKRHWNNATKMLTRRVSTPEPLAFFERHQNSGIENSYYLTEFIADAFSARDVFLSINQGEESCRGVANDELLRTLGDFICHMHNQGVFHRDLSAGNILLSFNSDKVVQPYLIDIGRARVVTTLSARQRLTDLMRICYKLPWSGREQLMQHYHNCLGREVSGWWRLAVRYYEFKQRSKKFIKRKK